MSAIEKSQLGFEGLKELFKSVRPIGLVFVVLGVTKPLRNTRANLLKQLNRAASNKVVVRNGFKVKRVLGNWKNKPHV